MTIYEKELLKALDNIAERLHENTQATKALTKILDINQKNNARTPERDYKPWKEDPATIKQKAFMTSHSIPFTEPISKGKASEKIDRYIEAQKKTRQVLYE
jgi:hypothetical protein